jgi:hypothetical protein
MDFLALTQTFAELESGQQDALDKAGERVLGRMSRPS